MAQDAITLRDVGFRYAGDGASVLSIPALDVPRGQRVALIGASGAGKSTLMRLLDGRLRGWSGQADVLGRRLDPLRPPPRDWRRRVGFVFQDFALVERADARRNVLNGRLGHADPLWSLFGRFTPADHAAAGRALGDVGMAEFEGRRVDRLSGGQRQRIAIARCLAQEPELILADEPISSLDPVAAETVLHLLHHAAMDREATLILSSHQPQLVAGFVDRFVALDRGRIVFDGPPDALDAPQLTDIYGENAAQKVELEG